MTTCPKCGAYIPDGGKMCISCGWKPEEDNTLFKDNPFVNYFQEVMDTVVDKFPKEELEEKLNLAHDNNRWIAAASYLGPAFAYTYYKYGDNELVRYHANQACLLFIARICAGVVGKLPVLGGPVKSLAKLGLLLLAFTGARTAVANQMRPVPLVGNVDVTILK